jgi:hypothetical protein
MHDRELRQHESPPLLVTAPLLRTVDREGVPYVVRVYARHEDSGAWTGWLEFESDAPTRPARFQTGRETTQGSLDGVQYWALGLGELYLAGAIERAQKRMVWSPPTPQRIVLRVHAAVTDPATGLRYWPRTCARWERAATWIGWVEFLPLGHNGPTLWTGHETSQPTLGAVRYWAAGLEPLYFDGAITRATAPQHD